MGNLPSSSLDSISGPIFSSSQSIEDNSGSSQDDVLDSQQKVATEPEELPGTSELRHVEERVGFVDVELVKESSSLPTSVVPSRRAASSGVLASEGSSLPTENVFKSFSSTPGYLANRWNAGGGSFLTPAHAQAPQFITPTM